MTPHTPYPFERIGWYVANSGKRTVLQSGAIYDEALEKQLIDWLKERLLSDGNNDVGMYGYPPEISSRKLPGEECRHVEVRSVEPDVFSELTGAAVKDPNGLWEQHINRISDHNN